MKSKLLKSFLLLMVLAIGIQLQAQTQSPQKALSFDGVNDYISGTGISTSLTAFTIEAWVYHNTLPAVVQRYITINPEVVVLRYDGTIYGGTNALHFYIKKANGSLAGFLVENVLTTGTWMHVAGTYDGTTMKLYLNGSLIKSTSPAGGLYPPSGSFSFSAGGSEAFNGKMDEVSVWNCARSVMDIREDMYRDAPIANSNLKNYWKFNNGTGTTLTDSKGTATGTLNNMTNANWIASTIPFAAGAVNTQRVTTTGTKTFTGTGLAMNFTAKSGTDTIVASHIDTLPNTSPTGVSTVFNSQYWVVNRFGSGTFTSNLTFTISEDLLPIDQSIPSRIKLYTRPQNSDGAWSFLAVATSVDAVFNKATFSGINAFSQFMVCKNEEGVLPTFTMIGKNPDFALITNNFNSIDVGTHPAPTFTNIDGDPFLDLLIGEYDGNINYYEQVSQNSYSFTLVSSNLSSIDISTFAAPCITNLGDDDLLDLIIGENDANLYYYEQNSENSTGFTLVTSNFVSNNLVGQQYPTITDLDNDGLLDLMVGKDDGKLYRYEQNSVNSTSFTWLTDNFSAIDVGNFSSPVFTDFEDDGLLDIIIGNTVGNLHHYEQNSLNSEAFSHVSTDFLAVDVGDYARPTVKDIDNDLLLDLIIGEIYGRLIHYEQQETTSIAFNDVLVGSENTRSYHIKASALTGNLTVTCLDNFTVSLSPESGFGQSIEIVPVDGEIREEVFIRVVLPATGAYSGNISHTTAGASTKYIAVSANGTEIDNFPGKSLAFDGTNDYVNIDDHSSLDLTNNYTLEAWIKPQSFNFLGGIISKYQTSGANGFTLRLSSDSPYNGLNFDGKTTQNNILTAGQWYHIAAVNNNGTRTMYVNGEITALSGTPGTVQANDNPLRIGVDYLPSARYFNGEIDEVRIWNVARTEAQIREFMHQALTGDKTGLVGYWQLNEESGTLAPEPILDNTGTLTNMDNADWVTSTAPLPFVSIANGNWSNPATWNTGQGVPEKDWTRVKVNNAVVLDLDKTTTDLNIDVAGSLVVASTSDLTVSGNLTNNARTSGLVIQSDASGTGSLLHNSAGVAATINRYITGSLNLNANTYHLVSVPITPETTSTSNLFTGAYLYDFDVAGNVWHGLGNSTTTELDETRGYMIYAPEASHTYTFTGPMNAGVFSPLVTFAGAGNNLVPNPYPSAINWDAGGWTKTGIANSVYLWPSGGTGYVTYVDGVVIPEGTPNPNIIPAGQSFIVKATASPTFGMTDAVRVHNSRPFLKSNENTTNLLRIKATANQMTDEAVVRFKDDATPNADPDFDAWKLSGTDGAPQLYTVAADGEMLAINSLPYTETNYTVPLNFEMKAEETVTLTFNNIGSFDPSVRIFLKDELTNQTTNLSNQQVYTFIHNTENATNRFKLVFGCTIGINEPTADACKMWIAGNALYLNAPKLAGQIGLVEIYSSSGQKLMSKTIVLNELSTVELNFKGFVVAKLTAVNEVMTVKGILMR